MPEAIIGSSQQHMMEVNNSGCVPVAGYYNDVVYPLLVDSSGRLLTDAQVTGSLVIGSVIVSADKVYIVSGANVETNPNDFTMRYIQMIDNADKMQPVYMGFADPGTASGAAGWQIRKSVFSGTAPELISEVLFASGNNNFDKIWNDREVSPYS